MEKIKEFMWNGKTYYVVAVSDAHGGLVVYSINENGDRVNGHSHFADFTTLFDLSRKYGIKMILDDMAVTVEDEIKRGPWEKYVSILKEQQKNR